MAKFDIVTCPKCKTRIIPKQDGTCPSCQAIISSENSGVEEASTRAKQIDTPSKSNNGRNLKKASSTKSLTRPTPKLPKEEVEGNTAPYNSIIHHNPPSMEEPLRRSLARRDPDKMHPIAMPLILIGYILTVVWVLWSTVIAFFGGKLPVFGWELDGGILMGLFWVGCLWPIVFGFTHLIFKLLDTILWWLDERLRTLLRSNDESTNALTSISPNAAHDKTADTQLELLLRSGLTQTVMADIALGIHPDITISTLVTIGMPEATAKPYVTTMVDAFLRLPDAERLETQENMRQRMEAIDKGLSRGLGKDELVNIIMEAEGFTRSNAESLVEYCASVYRVRKQQTAQS